MKTHGKKSNFLRLKFRPKHSHFSSLFFDKGNPNTKLNYTY
jgi:hypothetical protein